MNDYYRILGVLDDAEDIVIKAAYRALAQRYHPDKWQGPKDEATKKMADINEAFSVLSDPHKRAAYDATRQATAYSEVDSEEDDGLLSSVERDWQKSIEYFPDLSEIAAELAQISKSLEYTFKVTLLEKKDFNNRYQFAKHLENRFLQKYFVSNKELAAFAKQLILDSHKNAARELNVAVNLLGSSVDADVIQEKIRKEFRLNNWYAVKNDATELLTFWAARNAMAMLRGMECEVSELGFFVPQYEVTYKGQKETFSMEEFKVITKKIARHFLTTKSLDCVRDYLK